MFREAARPGVIKEPYPTDAERDTELNCCGVERESESD